VSKERLAEVITLARESDPSADRDENARIPKVLESNEASDARREQGQAANCGAEQVCARLWHCRDRKRKVVDCQPMVGGVVVSFDPS
jgi:hypothetical protein